MIKAVSVALLAVVAMAGTAHAQRFTNISGEKLGQLCTSRERISTQSCEAYINGVSDAVSFYQRLRPSDGGKGAGLPAYICVPGDVTGVQLRQTVVTWAEAHKDQMNRQASGIVLQALEAAYKCPGEQPRVPPQ